MAWPAGVEVGLGVVADAGVDVGAGVVPEPAGVDVGAGVAPEPGGVVIGSVVASVPTDKAVGAGVLTGTPVPPPGVGEGVSSTPSGEGVSETSGIDGTEASPDPADSSLGRYTSRPHFSITSGSNAELCEPSPIIHSSFEGSTCVRSSCRFVQPSHPHKNTRTTTNNIPKRFFIFFLHPCDFPIAIESLTTSHSFPKPTIPRSSSKPLRREGSLDPAANKNPPRPPYPKTH